MTAIRLNDAFLFRVRPADLALIAFILGLTVFGMVRAHGRPGGEQAVVMRDGAVLQELPLGRDGVTRIAGASGTVTLEVRGRSVRIAGADCPRGLCRHTGWIRNPGEAIVCVPNKLSVAISGGGEGRYDAVTY